MAETSLREYIAYARAPADETAPLLYMNGWDVFNAHPELWSDGLDQLPGSIDNRSAAEYASCRPVWRRPARRTANMKLFVARAARSGMHQDNTRARGSATAGHKL